MTDYYKRYYERIVIFCSAFVEIIPLSFILGFYVSFTATRWWQQYTAIPWPDKLMNIIALYVPGNDVTSRVLRRTLMRYLNLTLVLVLRSISIPVKRRFPTKEHLVEAGFMSRPELEMYSSVPSHEFNTFWIPCTWFVNLLREAKSECRITDSGGIKLIMEEFNDFRSKCGLLWSYDWVSIPLVYTQVVTLSTQAFFLASLLGRQHIHPPKDQTEVKSHVYGEYYIPIFTLLQFILYMGLLKLGEQLINPFGDDDEDFELNWIIDRHLKVSFLGVDILNSDPPPLIKDNYFDEMDIKLPYTEAAVAHKVKTYRGSVAAFHVPSDKHALVIPEFADEHCDDEDECCSTIQSQKDSSGRQTTWNLFNRSKRKLSSSLDSFNSETMVEMGISEEREVPKLQPNSSWSSFLAEHHKGTTGVDDAKMPSWTPSKHQQQQQQQQQQKQQFQEQPQTSKIMKPESENEAKQQGPRDNLHNPSLEQLKQSSFSTSTDSSIINEQIFDPLKGRRESFARAGLQQLPPRRSPLHVYSKEFADAPIRIFTGDDGGGVSSRNQGDRSSLSSVSIKSFQGGSGSGSGSGSSTKPHKSLMKCHRSVDPHLRIRPFRSKVTFSEDTKAGDNTVVTDKKHSRMLGSSGGFYLGWDSSNESIIRSGASHGSGGSDTIVHKHHLHHHDRACSPFSETQKRRQSLDPGFGRMQEKTLLPVKPPEAEPEDWLHYQSLPNIQEEESLSTAQTPTESSPPNSSGPEQKNIPELTLHFATPEPSKSLDAFSSEKHLSLSSFDDSTSLIRRKSIKRQKSTDLADEDMKMTKLPSPPLAQTSGFNDSSSSGSRPILTKKQSSSDSNNSKDSRIMGILKNGNNNNNNNGNNSNNSNDNNNNNRKQASTESDTGSYHTVNSLYIEKPPSNSSSVDSFTSAIDDSSGASGVPSRTKLLETEIKPLKCQVSSFHSPTSAVTTTSGLPLSPHNPNPSLSSNVQQKYLPSFAPIIETSLVPKIVFSTSTPSVTSQSSDDQSPRWDQRYSGFESSRETIKESFKEPSTKISSKYEQEPNESMIITIDDDDDSSSSNSHSPQISFKNHPLKTDSLSSKKK